MSTRRPYLAAAQELGLGRDGIAGCEAAWEFHDGVFGTVIPDNMKAIVLLVVEPDVVPLQASASPRRMLAVQVRAEVEGDGDAPVANLRW